MRKRPPSGVSGPAHFCVGIEREDIETAGKENDADQPADDRAAPGVRALADGEQGQGVEPLVEKGGVPEIEMVLPVKKIVDRAVGGEGAEDDAEEAEEGARGAGPGGQRWEPCGSVA